MTTPPAVERPAIRPVWSVESLSLPSLRFCDGSTDVCESSLVVLDDGVGEDDVAPSDVPSVLVGVLSVAEGVLVSSLEVLVAPRLSSSDVLVIPLPSSFDVLVSLGLDVLVLLGLDVLVLVVLGVLVLVVLGVLVVVVLGVLVFFAEPSEFELAPPALPRCGDFDDCVDLALLLWVVRVLGNVDSRWLFAPPAYGTLVDVLGKVDSRWLFAPPAYGTLVDVGLFFLCVALGADSVTGNVVNSPPFNALLFWRSDAEAVIGNVVNSPPFSDESATATPWFKRSHCGVRHS